MVVIRGKNTLITKLERKHVDEMQFWGSHKDPLFFSYTFPKMDKKDRDYWFSKKSNSFRRKSYAVYDVNTNNLIGYFSLRNIKWFRRSSELGIVFDPNIINNGYGTDSLKSFIPFYFEVLKMKRLDLKVAEFNVRAQKCYLNCGFKATEIKYDEFEDQELEVFEDEKLSKFAKFFKTDNDILQCRFIHMHITKEMYLSNK